MTNEPTSTQAVQAGLAVRIAGNDEINPDAADRGRALFGDLHAARGRRIALKFMRAYVRAVRDYNDALRGRQARRPQCGRGGRRVLTEFTFIKDPKVHREITPAAIDPDGRSRSPACATTSPIFKEQKLLADPSMTVERIVDTSIAERAVKELGPYEPRG